MKLMTGVVLPAAVALYGARLISGKLSDKIPGINSVPANMRQPVLAGGLLFLGHLATKKVKQLKKYRLPIMVGLSMNLIDKVLIAVAPQNVKDMIGLSDYVSVDDYIAIDSSGRPIQDNIAMSDYVAVGQYEGEGLEQDLGMLEQDLGLGMLEQDLGIEMDLGSDFADRYLGGVSRSSMRAPVGHKRYLAPVPGRSFTAPVKHISDEFDASDRLYTGIFAAGFGN